MDTQLIVKDTEGNWKRLDMYEDLSVNVVIQETDITDISSRRSPFSKVFVLPGSKINKDYFEHFYEVNSTRFNPLIRRECVVQYRGTDIFKGFLRINRVLVINDAIEFEVFILSEVADFQSLISDLTLKDLSWTYLNHFQTYDNVYNSWFADYNDNGLFGGRLLYPMINHGLIYDTTGSTPQFDFTIGTGTTDLNYSGTSIQPSYFKPSIRLKEVVTKVLETTGYEIESDFFDSEYFTSIYMSLSNNGQIGVTTASGRTNQNVFRTYSPPLPEGQKLRYSNGVFHKINFNRISDTDGYDPSNNFDETNYVYQVPVTGLYNFEFLGKVNQIAANNSVGTYYGFTLFEADTPEDLLDPTKRRWAKGTYDNYFALNYGQQNNQRVFLNDVQLSAGKYIGLFIRFNTSSGSNRSAGLWVTQYDGFPYGARWDLYSSPEFVGENFVDVGLQMPDISCLDLIKGVISLFNLVVVQTPEEKKFRIEPLTWYYSQNFAEYKDWTQLVDNNQAFQIEPLSYNLKKEFNFKYLTAEDEYLGKIWEEENIFPYGSRRFVASSDILTGIQEIEVPFRSTPTEVMDGSTNLIIPFFYELDLSTGRKIPQTNKPHLFFWVGNRYMFNTQYLTEPLTWRMTSGATPQDLTTYPCVSHLSNLDTLTTQEISDLNFDKNFDFFGDDNNVIPQFTEYNLYNLWYRDYFNNLYSPEVRRIKCRVFLTPLDIFNTKLTDKIYIKDSIYIIEKINEGDLVNDKLTEVNLIKQVSPYNKFVPPSPEYDIDPNQSYPSSAATYSISSYLETDKNDICNNPSGMTTIYGSFSSLTENIYIYQDSGGTTPYQTGTFVRESNTGMTYSVINNLGLIVEDPC